MAKKVKKGGGRSKQDYADIRTKTFESLETLAKDWIPAPVKTFNPHIRVNEETGLETVIWIPQFTIPVGYTNPFKKTDEQSDDERHCQLCDHHIIYYGVILHHAKKLSLIVGMDCYCLYESDDARNVRLNLLEKLEDEFFMKRLREQKERLKVTLNDYLAKHGKPNEWSDREFYKFYSPIKRDQTIDWSKTKFYNHIAKYGNECKKIGFEPKMIDMTANQYKTMLQAILIDFKRSAALRKQEEIEKQQKEYEYCSPEWIKAREEIEKVRAQCRTMIGEIRSMNLIRIKELAIV